MGLTTKHWLLGIWAAFALGLFGSLDSSFILINADPATFNLGPQFNHTVKVALIFGLFAGAKGVIAYFKQSPLPTAEVTITKTQTQTTNVTSENK